MSVADSRRHAPRRRDAPPGARRAPRPPAGQDDESLLPPGRRDESGFWIPAGYEDPTSLFSPQQRRLQEKQRQAHRARRRAPGDDAAQDDPDPGRRRAPRVDSPRGSD